MSNESDLGLCDQSDLGMSDESNLGMSAESQRRAMIKWSAIALAATAAALLLAWLGRLAGVSLDTLLLIGAGGVALGWLILLVTVPWNLFFAARRAIAEIAVSRARGIKIEPAQDAEAARLASRMLRFAIGAHLCTAAASALIAYLSGSRVGYYVAAFYLVSAAGRPVAAYFVHVRERIKVLTRDVTYPRADVMTLKARLDLAERRVEDQRTGLRGLRDELHRSQSALADDLAHARHVVTTDMARLADAQAADKAAAYGRAEDLERKIDQMARRIEATLDGISDHQELLTGIRALVRMVRTDPA
jgi:hypothetical protein